MKLLKIMALQMVLLIPGNAICGDLGFFNGSIDYWQSAHLKTATVPSPNVPEAAPVFDWGPYLDPHSEEFFREGDYVPPAPFLAVARNPSDENLKKWLTHIERKNALAQRFETRLQDYLARTGDTTSKAAVTAQPPTSINSSPLKPERFRLRLYFDSTCPHCRHMFETLAELQRQGFAIEGKQIDQRPLLHAATFPVSQATAAEIAHQKIEGVPLLLVADIDRGVMSRISGYHDEKEVLSVIQSMNR